MTLTFNFFPADPKLQLFHLRVRSLIELPVLQDELYSSATSARVVFFASRLLQIRYPIIQHAVSCFLRAVCRKRCAVAFRLTAMALIASLRFLCYTRNGMFIKHLRTLKRGIKYLHTRAVPGRSPYQQLTCPIQSLAPLSRSCLTTSTQVYSYLEQQVIWDRSSSFFLPVISRVSK